MKILLIFLVILGLWVRPVWADELADIEKQIAAIEASMAPLKNESEGLRQKIGTAKTQISTVEKLMANLTVKMIDQETDLEVQKVLMAERVKRYYVNSKRYSPLLMLMSGGEGSGLLRQYALVKAVIAQDKNQIQKYISDLNKLTANKVRLETEKIKISKLKSDMESRFGFLAGEIQKAETYKAELSRRQQQLIAEKMAMFTTSVGEAGISDDPNSSVGYNPGFSPAFAAFSFGAPHRKGMSQFGAYGRAKAGQNYESILKTYYGDIRIEKQETDRSIKTSVGTLPFENNYLMGIAEMPAGWGDKGGYEALKAQAIAARTYALAYTNNLSGSICVTEACQVYKRSKYENPGTWKRAVEETRGMVIVSNKTGKIFSTMYASTAGGAVYGYTSADHSTPQIWDTNCGNFSCWPGEAYEKASSSSWFYKGWYKTRSNLLCGRSHPWLTETEFSDLINSVIYYVKTKDTTHLSQYETGGCFGGRDPDAWSPEELRRQVNDKGGPVTSINSVGVEYSTGGVTKSVKINTDKGELVFSGEDFKQAYVLRAPGAISIKSSLFNLEKK